MAIGAAACQRPAFLSNSKFMDEQSPLEFREWARRYRGMAGVAIPDTPEGNRALFKLREDYGTYVGGFDPAKPPQYITLTNRDDNSQVRGIMEDGKFREIPVDKITTPKGTFALQTATNAAPIYLPDGSVAQNYTSDPTMGGAPAPGIGGAGMAVTNAPAMTNAPTASPTPYPEGSKLIKRSGENAGKLHQIVNGVPQLITGQ